MTVAVSDSTAPAPVATSPSAMTSAHATAPAMTPAASSQASITLGIETSCDETAAAVVKGGVEVLSSVVSSQISLHRKYGGVVPEVASRAHIEQLLPVIDMALHEAKITPQEIDVVAATAGPGLVGALLVGVSAAKALSLAWEVPFAAVNHLEGHIYAAFLEEPDIELPVVVLLVSGGHTMLVEMQDFGEYHLLGQTCDDAAGEAFDKVARLLDLGYPGGPEIDRLAARGNPEAVPFPRPMLRDGLDFSFSGLKTAVANYLRTRDTRKLSGQSDVTAANPPAATPATQGVTTADIAASFQQAVVDVLVAKTARAVQVSQSRQNTSVNCACLAGGVAANSALRVQFAEAMSDLGVRSFIPSRAMCTDNAAMIASAGWWQFQRQGSSELTAPVNPSWPLATAN